MANAQEIKLSIPPGCHGHDLQELMYKFVNWFSLANERRDSMAEHVAKQKLIVELAESKALLMVEQEIADNKEGRVSIDSKKARAITYSMTINNEETTPFQEKIKLAELQGKLSNIESKVKQLERLISVCQSSLSFDRQEISMLK